MFGGCSEKRGTLIIRYPVVSTNSADGFPADPSGLLRGKLTSHGEISAADRAARSVFVEKRLAHEQIVDHRTDPHLEPLLEHLVVSVLRPHVGISKPAVQHRLEDRR